ncbi:MAG: hypothetical protein N2Z23_00975 [Pyrinomonadaceae bacterium]|nr:hypothetical protein [Pyrinomonadaceae bacterium]MCX7639006.1 hypothetical protein [Pyrinomonadaceae bacterium]MDW8303774.1 hypothetical protein [Acidobacteriota bacterium]
MKEQKCVFSDNLVSYIYDEMENKDAFEAHLTECQICSEELEMFKTLRVSLSALREQVDSEFEPISIPVIEKPAFWKKLLEAITLSNPLVKIAFASALIIIFSLTFYLLTLQRTSDLGLASNVKVDEKIEPQRSFPFAESKEHEVFTKENKTAEVKPIKTERQTRKKLKPSARQRQQLNLDFAESEEVEEGIRLVDLFEKVGEV